MRRPSKRKLIPPSALNVSYIDRAPQLSPRIGHQYQVEVPSMIKESELAHNEVEDSGHEGWRYLGQNDGAFNITVPVAEVNCNNSWSDADVKSFLLGLFIFGKNFVQIKRFLENKEMGEILSFYYGKFYKSDEYRRWSDCKKIKGRKCITGDKLFSGQKHIELLSRLTGRVSEEQKDAFQQVSKSYSEGRTSLEEYVYSLKSTFGLGVLVEAVGIGKGKEDLTSPAMKCGKKTQDCSIQASKAWSSLGPCDIIKLLTGDYQSCKAKSNDIFWEAIWPRLLARGWHSEKLKNQGHLSSKNVVVFLLPGVKKFSKRKLVKGDHYFDSVRDVLSKVIAEPNLLKLEVLKIKVGGCNEKKAEKGSNKDGQPDNHHQCYLKHQVSTNCANHSKGKFDNIYPGETEAAMVPSKENNNNADANYMAENCENQMICVASENQIKRSIRHKFIRRPRLGHLDLAGPPTKLLKLSPPADVETDHIFMNSARIIGSEKQEPSQSSCIPHVNNGSVELENERRNIIRACVDEGISGDKVEKCEPQHTIYLNESQVLLMSEDAELMTTAQEDKQDLKPKDIIPRRSTRNRPLTARALESFLQTQRKGKRKDTLSFKDPLNKICNHSAHDRGLKNAV
ncbi:uncharacterized protein LOC111242312 [Vigna radiata var. radiata]|uniref:Uncharacterized protein LOC111242312 n=1 Tax=Vigna radiata var. radiata TaxID=3916 RepID=A0A3Q0FA42_VIGRR|nr:uncharacterized protein LOC111242312 [Vigna radiata var. radiata]XP_022640678.1 uncharacterized protein LOC111242312 [Vigna radiata var. radiata]